MMIFTTKLAAIAGATALAATALVGVQVVNAPPAQAASCTFDTPTMWSVYNRTCTGAQHFDVISGKTYKYALSTGRGGTSKQSVCWANVTSYGASVWV